MITRTAVIGNETGLHARPASRLSKLASDFKSEIKIKYKDKEVDAKSVISILSNALPGQSKIELVTNGQDEEEAMVEIVNLLECELGE